VAVRPVIEGFFEREFNVEAIETGRVGFIWKARENLSFDGAFRGGRASGEARRASRWPYVGLRAVKGARVDHEGGCW